MEENNKFETNTGSSGSGSMLYGTQPPPQEKEGGYSSVYGTGTDQPEPAATQPVQLSKPSGSEPQAVPAQPEPFDQFGSFGQSGSSQPSGQQVGYGQPGYNSNPVGFGPIQVPPPIMGAPEAKPKKSKAGLVVGILCAAAVIIVIGIGALIAGSLFSGSGDARSQLAKAMANMAKEMAAYRSSVAEDIGFAEISKLKSTRPIHTNIDLSFTDPNATGSITNIDVELDGVSDFKNKMAEYEVSLGTYGINMSIGTLVAAGNTLYVSVPIVFHDEVYSLDLTNLGRDFNDSAWSDLMDETLPEDYSLTLFNDAGMSDDSKQSGGESVLQKILQQRGGMNTDAMEFEVIKQTREFAFDGTFAEYGGVRVTMDKETYNESMETMKNDILASDYYAEFMRGYQTTNPDGFGEFKENMDYFIELLYGIRCEQDIVIDFYLDKKGRIVNISTPEDIAVSSRYVDVDSMAVDIDFSGRERALDAIEGGIYVQAGDEILYLGISREASITDDYYSEDLTLSLQDDNSNDDITFWYACDWGYTDQTFDLQISVEVPGNSIELRADGAYTDIVKGEGYTFRLNHGAISSNGEDLLLMAGSVETGPADNDIEVPEDATNILEMSMEEIMSLFYGTLY